MGPWASCLMLASGEAQMDPGHEQTLVQSLVLSLADVTVESAPKSLGHFWPPEQQGEIDVPGETLGLTPC